MANILNVHKSTISREIHRNYGPQGYRPKQAHNFTHERKFDKVKQNISSQTWKIITALIEQESSPE